MKKDKYPSIRIDREAYDNLVKQSKIERRPMKTIMLMALEVYLNGLSKKK